MSKKKNSPSKDFTDSEKAKPVYDAKILKASMSRAPQSNFRRSNSSFGLRSIVEVKKKVPLKNIFDDKKEIEGIIKGKRK